MRIYSRTQKANRTYMTIEQYAAWCGISKDTVIRRINKGILRIYQPERRGRVLIELENDSNDKATRTGISDFAKEFAIAR
ncbi:MAG: hypothetical protein GX749_01655 [Ruminococcaceae bacterium]|nr:hypothetical protein [Oscillospiraceae bacterium]